MPATVTGGQIITDAMGDLNVLQQGDTLAAGLADGGTDALRRLNLMVGNWANQALTIPAVSRLVFPVLANKGSSTNPYTVGTGGDINTPRPTFQTSVVGAGLQLNSSQPVPIEIPRGLATNDGWRLIRNKDLPSTLFTTVYYRPDFTAGFGSLFLWPVPTDLTNSIVLYIEAALTTFADLTTQYTVPDGYDEALHWNLARALAIPYGRGKGEVFQEVKAMALTSLAAIKRVNEKMADMENDFSTLGLHRRGIWNIQTGEPQG